MAVSQPGDGFFSMRAVRIGFDIHSQGPSLLGNQIPSVVGAELARPSDSARRLVSVRTPQMGQRRSRRTVVLASILTLLTPAGVALVAQAPAQQPLDLQAVLPLDPAVHTGRL